MKGAGAEGWRRVMAVDFLTTSDRGWLSCALAPSRRRCPPVLCDEILLVIEACQSADGAVVWLGSCVLRGTEKSGEFPSS